MGRLIHDSFFSYLCYLNHQQPLALVTTTKTTMRFAHGQSIASFDADYCVVLYRCADRRVRSAGRRHCRRRVTSNVRPGSEDARLGVQRRHHRSAAGGVLRRLGRRPHRAQENPGGCRAAVRAVFPEHRVCRQLRQPVAGALSHRPGPGRRTAQPDRAVRRSGERTQPGHGHQRDVLRGAAGWRIGRGGGDVFQ
ncbi:hypothetical protein [Pseudomonas sp. 8 R 14]|nr:hypothetical protein [Pseudomonas sp. 8 R 14]